MMNKVIKILEYQDEHQDELLHLMELNTPQYFAPEEALDFKEYLESKREWYYVVEYSGKIVGCGGINFSDDKSLAKISWDIIHPDFQGKSIGAALMQYRLEQLSTIVSVQKIKVRTSQLAFRFYEKQGFHLINVVKDFWAKGFDLYDMEYLK